MTQLRDLGGQVLRGERADHQLAVLIDPHRFLPTGQNPLELAQNDMQLGVHPRHRYDRVRVPADQDAELGLCAGHAAAGIR